MGLIHEKIPVIAAEVGAITKSRKNEQQGYRFRGIDDVYNALHAPLAKHGVFVVSKVHDLKREERQTAKGGTLIYTTLLMDVTFFATDGSSITVTTAGEAMDSGDKSANKAMSAAMKYAHFLTFTIPTETNGELDTESAPSGPIDRRDSAISSDPTTAYWQWVRGLEFDKDEAKAIVKRCNNNFDDALDELKRLTGAK